MKMDMCIQVGESNILQLIYSSAKLISIDVKLDNIFVNHNKHASNDVRFSDVQLGDLGGAYPADSEWAKKGTPVGAPMWSSPEVIMETPWNTATDIWSFGAIVSTLIPLVTNKTPLISANRLGYSL